MLIVSGRWRYDGMALLLEIIVAAVAIPLILLVWELIKQEGTTLWWYYPPERWSHFLEEVRHTGEAGFAFRKRCAYHAPPAYHAAAAGQL